MSFGEVYRSVKTIMARAIIMIVTVLLCTFLQLTEGIRYSEVFPHGVDAGDTVLAKGDTVSATVTLQTSLPVFGRARNQLIVSKAIAKRWVAPCMRAALKVHREFLPFALCRKIHHACCG